MICFARKEEEEPSLSLSLSLPAPTLRVDLSFASHLILSLCQFSAQLSSHVKPSQMMNVRQKIRESVLLLAGHDGYVSRSVIRDQVKILIHTHRHEPTVQGYLCSLYYNIYKKIKILAIYFPIIFRHTKISNYGPPNF